MKCVAVKKGRPLQPPKGFHPFKTLKFNVFYIIINIELLYMSYNARLRAKKNRAGGLYGFKRGWEVGSNASLGIGIPSRLVRTVSERTTPMTWVDGELKDDRNLVVQQNTLSGVGRYRSQFNVDADGIKSVRHYLWG